MDATMFRDCRTAALRAAEFIAERAHDAVRARGRFVFALSGGETPLPMLEALARMSLPWAQTDLFQADERAAPEGSDARNLTHLTRLLAAPAGLPVLRVHAMPTEAADLAAAAAGYAQTLVGIAGVPPVLDLVHLGLGRDGHTASLVPGDAALEIDDAWVAATEAYSGHRRMTLTLPTLMRARCVLWLVCGAAKADMLARLLQGDQRIPAGRVAREHAWVLADAAALPSEGASR